MGTKAEARTFCFKIEQRTFQNHLNWASRSLSNNPVQAIYANILVLADKESQTLTLWGSDLSTWTTATIKADVGEGCFTALSGKLLGNVIALAPEGWIVCSCEKENLFRFDFATGGTYYIRGGDAKGFAESLPCMEEGVTLQVPLQGFLDGLSGTSYAFSTDPSKQVLQGIHLTIDYAPTETDWQCHLEFAATDGHRLGLHSSLYLQNPADLVDVGALEDRTNYQYTVPGKALEDVLRMYVPPEEEDEEPGDAAKKQRRAHKQDVALNGVETVTIRHNLDDLSEEYLAFILGEQMLITRTLQGAYPNYPALLPKTFLRTLQVERRLFLAVLRRIKIIADQSNNLVRLTLDPVSQLLQAQSEATAIGSGQETLPAQISGDPLTIFLNIKYLTEAVKSVSTQDVLISFNQALSPIVVQPVKPHDDSRHIALTMPVQPKG